MAERDPGPHIADRSFDYDTDVFAWTEAQAELLRARRWDQLDLDNIVEEIESLGSEQIHAVESHMTILGEHLIKLAVSTDQDPRHQWRKSVREARRQIHRRLARNPSLRRMLASIIVKEWPAMLEEAIDGLHRDTERAHAVSISPFTEAQLLDPDFFPGD